MPTAGAGIARDEDEALQYFLDTIGLFDESVIPGKDAGVYGSATSLERPSPHVQIVVHTCAGDWKLLSASRHACCLYPLELAFCRVRCSLDEEDHEVC